MSTETFRMFTVHSASSSPTVVASFLETHYDGKSKKVTDWGHIEMVAVYDLKNDYSMGLVTEWEYVFDKRKLALLKLTEPEFWEEHKAKFDLHDHQVEFIENHQYTIVTDNVLKHLSETE